jgi:hypothetical protein
LSRGFFKVKLKKNEKIDFPPPPPLREFWTSPKTKTSFVKFSL